MSNAIGLWLPVLFLANVVALFLVILSKKSIKPKLSRSDTGPPKDDVIVETSDSIAPITLVWKNVNCCVGTGATQKKVLAGVYGRALPGEVSVIMGPSGAGKSTLLDVLSFRKKTGKTTGDIIVNGELRTKDVTSIASYVPQEDNFVPCLSCLETLQLHAGLLLHNASKLEREQRVASVLADLGLKEHRHTLVGGILPGGVRVKGLSGGQLRRLNVGTGIISSPSIVFMDELTTGLDSFTALSIMRFVKELAINKGHTIIATIHQPRLDIWNLVSRVSLLSKGMLLFEGKTEMVLHWFTTHLDYPYHPEVDGTLPEWCLDLISVDFAKDPSRQSIESIEDLQAASELFFAAYNIDTGTIVGTKLTQDLDEETPLSEYSISLETPKSSISVPGANIKSPVVKKKQLFSFFQQFLMLCWRCFAFISRNPADLGGRLFTISSVAAFLGSVFYNLPDGPESITTRFNVLFMTALVLVLFPYLSVSHATGDKVYYYSDISSRLYSPLVYYFAKSFVQLPFQFVNASVFILIVYGMTGLRPDTNSLIHHLLVLILAYLIFTQILNLAATIAPSEDLTFMIGVCFVAFNLMFSDFFIRKDQMRFKWLGTLSWLSPMKYIFEALTYIEFADRDFYTPCVADFEANYDSMGQEAKALLPLPKPALSFVLKGMSDDKGICLVSGNGFLRVLGNQRPVSSTVVILVSFLSTLHIVTFAALWFNSRNPVKR